MAEFSGNRHISNLINMSCKVVIDSGICYFCPHHIESRHVFVG